MVGHLIDKLFVGGNHVELDLFRVDNVQGIIHTRASYASERLCRNDKVIVIGCGEKVAAQEGLKLYGGLFLADPVEANGTFQCLRHLVADQCGSRELRPATAKRCEDSTGFGCMVLVGQMPFCRDGRVDD